MPADLLARTIAGMAIEHPLCIAAGVVKTFQEHTLAIASPAAAITIGSATLQESIGNPGTTLFDDPPQHRFSLNAIGLRNLGSQYYEQCLGLMVRAAQDFGKQVIFSIAGSSPTEYERLATIGLQNHVGFIECNFSCPNRWQNGKQERMISYDIEAIEDILTHLTETLGSYPRLSVKLSPTEPYLLAKIAAVLEKFPIVKAVTSTNTYPNAFAFTEKMQPALDPNNGFGGMGGTYLKPINLGQVRQLRQLLPNLPIIAVGGISTAQDIAEYLACGATAVAIATQYALGGPKAVERLYYGMANLLELGTLTGTE